MIEQSLASVEHVVKTCVAEISGLAYESIDSTGDFETFGIDSAGAVSLVLEVEDRLGLQVELDPEILFEKRSIQTFSSYLESLLTKQHLEAE